MVTTWYECDVCKLAYPHIDEAQECEKKHGKTPISVYYGEAAKGGMTLDGLIDVTGWRGYVEPEPKRLKH